MIKPGNLEQVKKELDRVNREIEEQRESLKQAKDAVITAKANGDKELIASAVKELDSIYGKRAALKTDLYFLLAVEKELLES